MPEAVRIRRMFSTVAPRYDQLNRVLSLGIDRAWRRTLAKSLAAKTTDRILDLCCGTGDLALELSLNAHCIGTDFTWEMLTCARRKSKEVPWAAADTLKLPFLSGTFDGATIAFGLRNLENMHEGLKEIKRVLRDDGVLAILEFSHPTNPMFRIIYQLYLKLFLPTLGYLLSQRGGAYRYLAESIIDFPKPEKVIEMLHEAGFSRTSFRHLSGGIVAIHTARA